MTETQTIRLSSDDQRRFVEVILNPPPPLAAMKCARDAHERLIAGQRQQDEVMESYDPAKEK